ncbi:hypothetical protein Rhe02_69590 [Rhizocola hellebori]|uniref:Uncharacterized protein n=1 Tax=Rhizocola hellebori TaxID=1392758 RepID=A0A8J3VJV8_9ACTN|nr:hypothetical protein Rhe02_69590 [Rhizocola hellebori]
MTVTNAAVRLHAVSTAVITSDTAASCTVARADAVSIARHTRNLPAAEAIVAAAQSTASTIQKAGPTTMDPVPIAGR